MSLFFKIVTLFVYFVLSFVSTFMTCGILCLVQMRGLLAEYYGHSTTTVSVAAEICAQCGHSTQRHTKSWRSKLDFLIWLVISTSLFILFYHEINGQNINHEPHQPLIFQISRTKIRGKGPGPICIFWFALLRAIQENHEQIFHIKSFQNSHAIYVNKDVYLLLDSANC